MICIRSWPRWAKELVLQHPSLVRGHHERIMEHSERLPVVDAVVDCFAETLDASSSPLPADVKTRAEDRMRSCLEELPSLCNGIVLTHGFDADGTRHPDERILFTPAAPVSYEEETSDGTESSMRHDEGADAEGSNAADAEGSNAADAEVSNVVDALVETIAGEIPESPVQSIPPPPASPIRRHGARTAPHAVEDDTPDWLASHHMAENADRVETRPEVTRLVLDGNTVEQLHGVVCPALLEHLAAQHNVHLVSIGGTRYPTFRVGKRIQIGAYAVSSDSYSEGSYTVLDKQSGMAPLRRNGDVHRLHRIRRGAFERR